MEMKWLVLTTISVMLAGAAAALGDRCNTKSSSCSDCYTTEGCVFCGAKDLNSTLNRCVSEGNIPVAWESQCPPKDRYKPESNSTITDKHETEGRKIRLTPRKITVDLGEGQSHNFTISVNVRDNPQLELYILMDLSRTMYDDKETVENTLQELIAELQKLTTDLPRIGFGAFVEKPISPYVSLADTSNDAAACKDMNCDKAWGFRNYKKLTDSSDDVQRAIKHAPVAKNVDPLEGGFDGVMQSIVCNDVIGWTEGTEKMLVYLSDSAPHMAGDGKLAGISIPNDMKCHMEPEEISGKNYTHVYSYSTIMDYPSVGQIAQKAEEEGMHIFFLTVDKVIPLYKRISHNIKSSSYAILEESSENIVELITNEYEKIQQSLSLDDDAKAPVTLKYYSKCKGSEVIETKTCSKLEKENTVEFIIEATMVSCDTFKDGESQIISIRSFGDEKNPIELTINPLCKCECEDNNHPDYDGSSPECNSQGDLMCGVCKCDADSGYAGKTCDCFKSDVDAGGAGCRQGNSTVECNGKGSCYCNECECEEGYTGDYCECNNNICKRGKEGKLCSGNGDCDCGECLCYSDWTGEACDCSSQTDNCINPATDETCSSNGACECNMCACNNTVNSYTGVWCQTCIDCPKRCTELGPCVLCQHTGQGGSEVQCEEECSRNMSSDLLQFTFLDKLEEPTEVEVLCSTYDSDDCRISFIYGPGDDGGLHLKVLKKKECPTPPPILPIVLGIIGAIVVLGLIALLAWKCYANYLDRKAYQKFLMEQANAKWSDNANPLYKSPKTEVMNPVFGIKQD